MRRLSHVVGVIVVLLGPGHWVDHAHCLPNSAPPFQSQIPTTKYVSHQAKCQFPSVYKRNLLYECIYFDKSSPEKGYWWCPTEDNYDYYPIFWRPCKNTSETYAGNDPGQPCHFPFQDADGRLQITCLPMPTESSRWWCATTDNFQRDKKWTYCQPNATHILPCQFSTPSVLSSSSTGEELTSPAAASVWSPGIHEACVHFHNKFACIAENAHLRHCPDTEHTHGGNDPGSECYFPFLMSNIAYSTCIPLPQLIQSRQHSTAWKACSTTQNFDRDKKWTICKEESVSYLHQWLTSQRNAILLLAVVCIVILALCALILFISLRLKLVCQQASHSQALPASAPACESLFAGKDEAVHSGGSTSSPLFPRHVNDPPPTYQDTMI